ncbi:MAG: PQQ-dependent sugar dehydrogenase, partial [Caulobacteraceae bacterium]|nr:PQQ-dependent sugar dehydrogenase [Caulobacteraceae bacterium]
MGWAAGIVAATGALACGAGALAQERVGPAAYGDWRTDAPGVIRRITVADMPKPYASAPTASPSAIAPRPAGAMPKAPPGFTVAAFAKLDHPRQIRVAPNGDIFVAETEAGQVSVLRSAAGSKEAETRSVFANGLDRPFGIAFYPARAPRWVYIANNNSVVRYPYQAGDLKARAAAQTVVAKLADSTGGHSTRDIAVAADGRTLLVSIGSGSNVAEGMPAKTPAETAAWAASNPLGAAWGRETGRAVVLSFQPDGSGRAVVATGIRNCVSVTVNPATGEPWCAVNERDSLGDDLPPDYVTRVKAGAFYGWPWFYIGAHEDPRLKGRRPDLAGKVTVPDVLIQPHSAPLGLAFYEAKNGVAAFPASYVGDAFVGLHGSWNRAKRTGYKVVRLKVVNGVP